MKIVSKACSYSFYTITKLSYRIYVMQVKKKIRLSSLHGPKIGQKKKKKWIKEKLKNKNKSLWIK